MQWLHFLEDGSSLQALRLHVWQCSMWGSQCSRCSPTLGIHRSGGHFLTEAPSSPGTFSIAPQFAPSQLSICNPSSAYTWGDTSSFPPSPPPRWHLLGKALLLSESRRDDNLLLSKFFFIVFCSQLFSFLSEKEENILACQVYTVLGQLSEESLGGEEDMHSLPPFGALSGGSFSKSPITWVTLKRRDIEV